MRDPAFVVVDGDRELYVSEIADGPGWYTVFRDAHGIETRVISAKLLGRPTRLDAEADLLIYARKHHWPVEWFGPRPEAMAEAADVEGMSDR
jgi:hypothetical protein